METFGTYGDKKKKKVTHLVFHKKLKQKVYCIFCILNHWLQ